MIKMLKRRRWLRSTLKEFVATLVLDKRYSVEQVALTAQIDENTVKHWVNKAERRRARRWRYKYMMMRIQYKPLFDFMDHYDWWGGIPENTKALEADE